jgi:lipid-A-disaccharide synthase
MNIPYSCLVNAIAGKTIVPEKLMYRDDYKWLVSQSIELLLNEEKREACIAGLKKITSLIGSPGASAKAADEALGMI